MFFLIHLLWVLLIGIESLSYASLCPVSTMPNFTGNSDHLYPMEIYFSKRIVNNVSIDPFEICRTVGNHAVFSCPLHSIGCPIIEDNVRMSLLKSMGWKKGTSMCNLKSVLQNPNATINVFVFGGSVTAGVDTGYCCSSPADACNRTETLRCAWPHYIQHWLRSTSVANVSVYNLAVPGTSSDWSAEHLQEYFDKFEITRLSRNDIILIDHSFNDLTMSSLPSKVLLERGLEKLIRRIMSYTAGEAPTIILMETDTRTSSKSLYVEVYITLAKYYGLRIYSYVDAVRSKHSIEHQKAYHHHLTHHHGHPLWHTHLIYADFVSAILVHEMNECDTTYKQDGSTPFTLPVSLFNVSDTSYCNPNYKPFLRVSYNDIQAGTVIGEYDIPDPRMWQVRLDRKGRGGIIAELNATDNFKEVQKAPIWFTLNFTADELQTLREENGVLVFHLDYLSSYVNAGQVLLSICGEEVFGGRVDSLWIDWQTYRYTTPSIFMWEFVECRPQTGSERLKIGLKHWIDPENLNTANMSELVSTMPRTRQLFKIISVMVCRYNG